MMFYVIKTVRVHGSVRHIARAAVTDVPVRTAARTVADTLEEAGYAPIEMGIVWANHLVKDVTKVKDVQLGLENEWTWDELVGLANHPRTRQLNVRIPVRLYGQCEIAARSSGVSLQKWVHDTLTRATAESAG